MRAALVFAVACGGDREVSPSRKDDTPLSTSLTGETSETGGPTPTDTGETVLPTDTIWPFCDYIGRTETVTLLGADRLDSLGYWLDAADTDGDGCAEIAVGAPWQAYYGYGEGAVYLLTAGELSSGFIDEIAAATWQETEEKSFSYAVSFVQTQVAWTSSARWEEPPDDYFLFTVAYNLPQAPLAGAVALDQRSGGLYLPNGYSVAPSNIGDCSGLGSPTLCMSTGSRGPDSDFAGAIWLYDAPLVGDRSILEYRARIAANDAERADIFESSDDLDGDGLDELVIGAYWANEGTGRVALVSDPPTGDLLLWDVAYATFDGVVDEGYAGFNLSTGDLDGDGYIDVWVGAIFPITDVGHAYVMSGPFSGAQSLDEASITVAGTDPAHHVGNAGAIGDMTGDGMAELVIGAPYSPYFNVVPGAVGIFDAPTSGSYLVTDADIQLTSGSDEPDAFGFAIASADIDGDGLIDLAIGAPDDNRNGGIAGSLTVVFGASL